MEKFNFDQFDDQRYRLSYVLQDAFILLAPILLTLLGALFLG